jgi:ferredoxin
MSERHVIVTVDAARCVGSATCTMLAPDSFELNDEDKAEPTGPVLTDVTGIESARDLCPTAAIHVRYGPT